MAALEKAEALRLRQEHLHVLQGIRTTNADFAERLKTEELSALYDADEDLFIVRLGEAREVVSESADNTTFLNVDPDTGKIVEIEFGGFFARMREDARLQRLFLDILRSVRPGGFTIQGTSTSAAQDVQELVQDLIGA